VGSAPARARGRSLILQRRKTQAPVAYLALKLGQSSSRETAISLLWGDVPDDRARHSLRQTLLEIRHSVRAPDVLRVDGDELGMRPLVAHCHLGLGKLYRRADKRDQAHEHLATGTTMYREMGMTYWLDKAEAEMANLEK